MKHIYLVCVTDRGRDVKDIVLAAFGSQFRAYRYVDEKKLTNYIIRPVEYHGWE